MALDGFELQRATLRLYGELMAGQVAWGGKLVFAAGAGCCATGLAAAVSIAGGCTLVLDPDAAAVKAVFRQGGVDFVVNTLDEALRVLKNEIRKGKPLSVALTAPVESTQAEMAERGVLPDWRFEVRPLAAYATWLAEHRWVETVMPASAKPALLEVLPAEDTVRRRWLERIGHYQRPGSECVVWLSAGERAGVSRPAAGSMPLQHCNDVQG